jgi:hypothetical protein
MLVSGLLAGFVLGLATGGNWRNLKMFELRVWPALLAGIGARAAAPLFGALAVGASVVGLVLVALVALVNRVVPGAWLIALGSALNATVTLANGGMPVDPAALALSAKAAPSDGLHVILGPETRVPFLADVLLAPVVNNIYSLGDLLIAVGGFWMAFRLVRQR